ncbi:hypothetical protein POM88_042748 [Heracleum sosnowskyi]|uniref:Uncharacterized protein n=1 Tax=Heracleum sosnowskyi TaxID=360622 RepID=A0AAD8MBZ2_9APIA|nr:hypothetical protein POM88_042748 [Heracleum sosnowskyi]
MVAFLFSVLMLTSCDLSLTSTRLLLFYTEHQFAEFQGRPLADHPAVKNGRPPGALTIPRDLLDASTVAETISVISCWYEDKTEWGERVGWIYGSVTEDVVTGLHQVLRWATGSVEIFFSRNNALLATSKMKFLQRIAYLNVGIYPFTSIFLIVYCFLPALSLFSGQFIVQSLDVTFLAYLLTITITLCLLAVLEVKWSGIELEERGVVCLFPFRGDFFYGFYEGCPRFKGSKTPYANMVGDLRRIFLLDVAGGFA